VSLISTIRLSHPAEPAIVEIGTAQHQSPVQPQNPPPIEPITGHVLFNAILACPKLLFRENVSLEESMNSLGPPFFSFPYIDHTRKENRYETTCMSKA
jgi:hypothetical protein